MSERLVRRARAVSAVYGKNPPPGMLSRVRALVALAAGDDIDTVAGVHGLRPHDLRRWGRLLEEEGDGPVLGLSEDPSPEEIRRARRILGQMLLGRLGEDAFVRRYRKLIPGAEFRIEDDRGARTDTDYRILNGRGRPVLRINIKFHQHQVPRDAVS